jgi:hypothetical protein
MPTFFPQGDYSSTDWFHNDGWLDFNMVEVKGPDNPEQFQFVIDDYHREPAKPTHLGEGASPDALDAPKPAPCLTRHRYPGQRCLSP